MQRNDKRLSRPSKFVQRHWNPQPIEPPKPDPDIEKLNGPQRSAEVIRYSILSFEFWLSPLGRLREWVRLNLKLSMILLIPGIFVLPLITWVIYLVAGWAAMLVGLAGNLILLPVAAVAAVLCFTAAIYLLKAMFRR